MSRSSYKAVEKGFVGQIRTMNYPNRSSRVWLSDMNSKTNFIASGRAGTCSCVARTCQVRFQRSHLADYTGNSVLWSWRLWNCKVCSIFCIQGRFCLVLKFGSYMLFLFSQEGGYGLLPCNTTTTWLPLNSLAWPNTCVGSHVHTQTQQTRSSKIFNCCKIEDAAFWLLSVAVLI